MKYVRLLQELTREDLMLADGKGANLGELVLAGMKVPQEFVLTVEGYRRCITKVHLPKINVNDLPTLGDVISKIQMEIENVDLPDEVTIEVLKAYRRMGSPKVLFVPRLRLKIYPVQVLLFLPPALPALLCGPLIQK